jgi:hypothetical protein
MRLIFKFLFLFIVALALGIAATWLSTGLIFNYLGVNSSYGNWQTNLHIGNHNANPYLRAYIARFGLLALNAKETMYFFADTDSEGRTLSPRCTYKITGKGLKVRWWSLTAYRDYYLIANPQNLYSYSVTTLKAEKGNPWEIILSPKPQPGNWLPSGNQAGKLTLTLRAYNPEADFLKNLSRTDFPKIIKLNCDEK